MRSSSPPLLLLLLFIVSCRHYSVLTISMNINNLVSFYLIYHFDSCFTIATWFLTGEGQCINKVYFCRLNWDVSGRWWYEMARIAYMLSSYGTSARNRSVICQSAGGNQHMHATNGTKQEQQKQHQKATATSLTMVGRMEKQYNMVFQWMCIARSHWLNNPLPTNDDDDDSDGEKFKW